MVCVLRGCLSDADAKREQELGGLEPPVGRPETPNLYNSIVPLSSLLETS